MRCSANFACDRLQNRVCALPTTGRAGGCRTGAAPVRARAPSPIWQHLFLHGVPLNITQLIFGAAAHVWPSELVHLHSFCPRGRVLLAPPPVWSRVEPTCCQHHLCSVCFGFLFPECTTLACRMANACGPLDCISVGHSTVQLHDLHDCQAGAARWPCCARNTSLFCIRFLGLTCKHTGVALNPFILLSCMAVKCLLLHCTTWGCLVDRLPFQTVGGFLTQST